RQRGVDADVGGPGAQTGIVDQGPFEPRLRQDRDPVARRDSELPEAERDGAHPFRRLAVRHWRPHAARLIPERGGLARMLLDRVKEQPRQRASGGAVHGRNRTTNVTGEPATRVPTARWARAVTTAPSRGGPPGQRSCTGAMPTVAARVSAGPGRRAAWGGT